jgi:spoIIIJ-associated protein
MPADLSALLKEKTETILKKMGFSATVSVEEAQGDNPWKIEITPAQEEDFALLIGYHGQTLNALQVILGIACLKETGEYTPLLIEAGGYRKDREESVKRQALEAADKARFLLKEVSLPPMPPFERRIAHTVLTEEEGVATESRGEGRDRHVVVVPKGLKKEQKQ